MRQAEALAFSLEEYSDRVSRTRQAMAEHGIDVLLAYAPEDIYYLCGFDSPGYYAYQFLALPREREPVLFVQEVEQAIADDTTWVEDVRPWAHGEDNVGRTIELIKELIGDTGTIGYQGQASFFRVATYERLRKELSNHDFVDASDIVAEMRLIKSPAEIAYVRQAARYADIGMQVAIDAVHEGVKETEVAAAMYDAIYRAGSGYAGMPFLISSGPHSAYLHGTATERKVRSGEVVTMEVGGVAARYNVNMLRSAVVGEPSERVIKIHAVLEEAVLAAEEAVKPGVPVADIDRITRKITAEYDKYRLHRTGYGLEAGYPPAWMGILSIHEADPHVLAPGMVFSIEPTIAMYDQDLGVVLGDQVMVTDDGCEVLTKTPLDLARR